MCHVQVDTISVRFRELGVDGAGDDVARRELGALVVLRHEATAVGIQELRAFAPQRLRDEEDGDAREAQRGRVELHELHIHHFSAGPVGDGNTITGCNLGIRAHAMELAAAARGEDDRAALERLLRVRPRIQRADRNGPTALDEHLLDEAILLNGNAGHAREGGER